MKSKSNLIKQVLLVFALMVGAITVFSVLPIAHAGSILNPSDNPGAIAEATGGETSLRQLILRIVNYALGFLGLLAVIMIIYGGVTYVTSAGGDGVENAKKIIMYAIIGLIVVLLAFVIVNATLGAGQGTETPVGGGGTQF